MKSEVAQSAERNLDQEFLRDLSVLCGPMLLDQPQQMVLGNLIFQAKVVEQRFRAVVLPHHDQQASDESKSNRAWADAFF